MSQSIRVLKNQWTLIADFTCVYQIQGKDVACHFTEAANQPSTDPSANQAGTVAYKTLTGGNVYQFKTASNAKLWAFPAGNGAVIIVDRREGMSVADPIIFSGVTAFGEQKVAEYRALAAWEFPYNISVLNYVTVEENGGTVSHDSSFAVLQTSAAADGKAELLTRRQMRYQPGIGGIVRFTAIYDTPVADSIQQVGYGNETDGMFFGYIGTVFGIIRISGGVTTFIPQSEWSEDVFGAFSPQKLNVYQIQFQWLGGGELRFYIESPGFGVMKLVHRIQYANSAIDVSIRNPSLPIQAKVENTGNTSNLTLKTPSASAGLEGNPDNRTLKAIQSADDVKAVSTTLIPIVSIRNPVTYEGLTNRLSIQPLWSYFTNVGVNQAIATFRILLNPTLTDPVWSQLVPGGAPAEADISATAITGGQQVTAITAGQNDTVQLDVQDFESSLVPGDILSIAAIATKATTAAASITFDSEV